MEQQQAEYKELVIRNEDDAFTALQTALKNEVGIDPLLVKFDKWPIIEIRLEGPGYESTITPDMAAALVELQAAINRSYARIVHHSSDSRKLTAEERRNIQFKAKVDQGSSLITVNLGEFAEKIGLEMVGRMDTAQLVTMVLGLAITGGSVYAYKAFLKHRTEVKQLGEETSRAIALSQEETKRMEVFANAVSAVPKLKDATEDFDVARHEIVRGTADANTLSVNSVKIDRDTAKLVASTPRSASRQVQLNGNYIVLETNWQKEDTVKLKLRKDDTSGLVFYATLQDDSFTGEQRDLVKNAEWTRSAVYMSINATELRGEITTATVLSVTAQPITQE